jgi:hypothetical protein
MPLTARTRARAQFVHTPWRLVRHYQRRGVKGFGFLPVVGQLLRLRAYRMKGDPMGVRTQRAWGARAARAAAC